MTSFRQFDANRRNALKSTGPKPNRATAQRRVPKRGASPLRWNKPRTISQTIRRGRDSRAADDVAPNKKKGCVMDNSDSQSSDNHDNGNLRRGRPFEPGTSGNRNGRPKGSRNKATLLRETLLEPEAQQLIQILIEKATQGDMQALRICIDRLLPLRRDQPVAFDLPEIATAADAPKVAAAVVQACADGIISLSEAEAFMGLIKAQLDIYEKTELAARVTALEKKAAA
jgi:hypothetical protein